MEISQFDHQFILFTRHSSIVSGRGSYWSIRACLNGPLALQAISIQSQGPSQRPHNFICLSTQLRWVVVGGPKVDYPSRWPPVKDRRGHYYLCSFLHQRSIFSASFNKISSHNVCKSSQRPSISSNPIEHQSSCSFAILLLLFGHSPCMDSGTLLVSFPHYPMSIIRQ